ncbi:hypothetical protein [Plantactinospora sp. B5E13]|uniref:hypothetical protein n=1 Tax=unclassified Plantactinospora TaxID=2631981 RepID=UPI00325EAC28
MKLDQRSRRRTRILLISVAALVAATLTGWYLVASRAGGPAGEQTVTSAGVRISVPAGWDRNATECGTPVRDTYLVDVTDVAACALTPAPRVDYAEIRRATNLALDPVAAVATTDGTAAGHPVRRGADVLPDGRARRVVLIPDRQVVVVAVADDPATADAIADSVRLD